MLRLASIYHHQQRFYDAEKLTEQVTKIFMVNSGREHVHILDVMMQLALSYWY
jgi:hypothetical protein